LSDLDPEVSGNDGVPGFVEGDSGLFPLNSGTIDVRPRPALRRRVEFQGSQGRWLQDRGRPGRGRRP